MNISETAKPPCKGCADRCIGCHTTCGDYAEYKATLEANRAIESASADEREFLATIKKAVRRRSK